MKMKKVINTSLFLFIVIANILLLVNVIGSRNKLVEVSTINESLQKQNSFAKENFAFLIQNRNAKINRDVFVMNQHGEQKTIDNLINNRVKLFLRIPEFSCTTCYEKTFQNFSELDSLYKGDSIIVLTSYSNVNSLYNFKRVNQVFSPTFNLKSSKLLPDSNLEEFQKPFFIELSAEGNVVSLQLVDKNNFQMVYDYFDALQNH